jgi:glyoxylase I family protein
LIQSKLSHVCFSTNKLESTFKFYTDILSYEVIHKFFNEEGKVYGLIFNIGGGSFLEFFESSEPLNSENLFRHFCIAVSDIFQLQDHLKSHGISIQIARGRTDKTLQAWISDPNGIKLEFHQYDNESLLFKHVL